MYFSGKLIYVDTGPAHSLPADTPIAPESVAIPIVRKAPF